MENKEGNEAVVKELLLGKADGFAREPLEAGAQGQVLAFQALQGRFARLPLPGGQTRPVGPPGIGQPLADGPPGGDQHGLQAPERGVGTPPKDEGQHVAGGRVLDPPEPALGLLAAHERPHFVGAQPQRGRRVGDVAGPHGGALAHGLDFFLSSPITVCGLMPSTRAVSRMPLPFKAMSVMWARTPGSCTLCR